MLPSSPLSFAHRHWHIAADAIHRFAACAAAFTGGRPGPPRSPASQPRLPSLAAARPTRRPPAGEPGATLRPTPRAPERLRPHPPGSTRGAVLCADAGRSGVLRAMTAPTPTAPGAYMAGVVDGNQVRSLGGEKHRRAQRSAVSRGLGPRPRELADIQARPVRPRTPTGPRFRPREIPAGTPQRRGRSLPRRPPGQAAPQPDALGARGILG